MGVAAAPRTVLFVCAHGAYRSPLAAAFFNASAPDGWRAGSPGVEPQAAVSPAALDLVVSEVGPAQRDELRARAEALAAELSAG